MSSINLIDSGFGLWFCPPCIIHPNRVFWFRLSLRRLQFAPRTPLRMYSLKRSYLLMLIFSGCVVNAGTYVRASCCLARKIVDQSPPPTPKVYLYPDRLNIWAYGSAQISPLLPPRNLFLTSTSHTLRQLLQRTFPPPPVMVSLPCLHPVTFYSPHAAEATNAHICHPAAEPGAEGPQGVIGLLTCKMESRGASDLLQ